MTTPTAEQLLNTPAKDGEPVLVPGADLTCRAAYLAAQELAGNWEQALSQYSLALLLSDVDTTIGLLKEWKAEVKKKWGK